MTVSDLLTASRAAHQRYHVASGQIHTDGTILRHPNEDGRISAVQTALDFRLDAEAADPLHADPAWAEDETVNKGVPSSGLLVFYRRFLLNRQR